MKNPAGSESPRPPARRGGLGPGWIVAAAFIGPGTVTTATLAGASFGTALLWALLFSTVATMVLQEMAARLGIVTRLGLGEAIRERFTGVGRVVAVGLVISAIGIGNAAYQTGNLLGGALGLEGALGGGVDLWVILIGGSAAALLWRGSYVAVERLMIGLVMTMSVVFLATAVVVIGRTEGLLAGLFVPSLPDGSLMVAIGLIGTTVVPYNLFLHASAVGERFEGDEGLKSARADILLSVGVGGLVSMAILVTSAGSIFGAGGEVGTAADMAQALEPVLGSWARGFFAVGLFAAGMTSSITAPLAAAWATAGALGWPRDLRDGRVRAVWATVLGVGVLFALLGTRPVAAILFAQAANGILLPAVAIFLLVTVNDRKRMGDRVNRLASNLAGGVVVLIATGLGVRALLSVFGLI